MDLRLVAVAATVALAVGAASGAWLNGMRWEKRYQAREIELLAAQLAADTAARKATHEIQSAADAIRNAPVRRVRCESAGPADVPGAAADPAVGDPAGVRTERDYGPALRELLACAAQVNRYADPARNP